MMNNKIILEKKRNKIILLLISNIFFILLFSQFIFSIDTTVSGYKVEGNSYKIVRDSGYDEGYKVVNNNALAIFVPTKTRKEYDLFMKKSINNVQQNKLSYSWSPGSWSKCEAKATYSKTCSGLSECSAACGYGLKTGNYKCITDTDRVTRSVVCENNLKNNEVDYWCLEYKGTKPSTSHTCEDKTCGGSSYCAEKCYVKPSCGSKPPCPSGFTCYHYECKCSGWDYGKTAVDDSDDSDSESS